jgi:dTDP-4-amino-4,6-dideoxygalactose transaminase
MIPFNKIHLTGKELTNIADTLQKGKIGGDGHYTKACESFFEKKYNFTKALLTPSCTAALEMAALLINIQPGDEVILPSYNFVSMANAFILRGAKLVFADSGRNNPNIDTKQIESLLTPATRAILVIHYGGIACDIIAIRKLADKHKLYLIEDAAQAIDSYYKGKPLGSFGHLATFSFHETKNITCGEGGMLVINDKRFIKRAEIIREKGTNRLSFIRNEIAKYSWVDLGSSHLASDISAAFLYAQLSELETIQAKRIQLWNWYYQGFAQLAAKGLIQLPSVPNGATHNGHVFYLIFGSKKIREAYIKHMALNNVQAQFHYVCLHNSPFYKQTHGKRVLPMAKFYQDRLVRLPLFYDMEEKNVKEIIALTSNFFSTTC